MNERKPYPIWANHAHVFPAGAKPGGEIERLKALMAECHIEKAVCFACFRDQYERSGLPGDPVGWLAKAIRDDDSLIGFGTVDFDREDITYQVERIAALGMKGIKIHPAAQEINVMGDKARQVYEAAQREGLFLSFHTGIHWHRISDYNLLLFDEVAWHYPELKFSMDVPDIDPATKTRVESALNTDDKIQKQFLSLLLDAHVQHARLYCEEGDRGAAQAHLEACRALIRSAGDAGSEKAGEEPPLYCPMMPPASKADMEEKLRQYLREECFAGFAEDRG